MAGFNEYNWSWDDTALEGNIGGNQNKPLFNSLNSMFSSIGSGLGSIGTLGGNINWGDMGKWAFGSGDQKGNLAPLLGAAGGIYQGMVAQDQLGLAKDQFNFQKGLANKTFDMHQLTLANALEDQARLRAYKSGKLGKEGSTDEDFRKYAAMQVYGKDPNKTA